MKLSRQDFHHYFYIFATGLLMFVVPLSHFAMGLITFLLTLNWLAEWNWKDLNTNGFSECTWYAERNNWR